VYLQILAAGEKAGVRNALNVDLGEDKLKIDLNIT
jgi:hypothetical protein